MQIFETTHEINWHKALQQQQMKWKQLIINKKDLDKVEASYSFSSILIVFIEQNGKELYRSSGFGNENLLEYQKIIDRLLVSIKQ